MKRTSFVTSILALALMCSFFGAGNVRSSSGEQPKTRVGFSVSTLKNPFFIELKRGVEEKAAERDIELITLDALDNPAKQLSDVEDLLERGIDVLLINPCDSDAVVPAVKAANRAHVPVICLDRNSASGRVSCYIASDNVEGGRMAARYIVEKLNGKGDVVVLEGIPGTSAARERGKGFNEVISNHPNIRVLSSQPANFDRAEGMRVMSNLLQAYPNIDCVFCQNDEMALGAIRAIEEAGREGIMVVGFDAISDALKCIKEGKMAATIQQQPVIMGNLGVENACRIVNGEKTDSYIPVPLKLICGENIETLR
jgi:ribose transport system substrate-binding protein